MTDNRSLLARAVADAVFSCLLNAERDPVGESKWRSQADKLERKFSNEYGMHYADCMGAK